MLPFVLDIYGKLDAIVSRWLHIGHAALDVPRPLLALGLQGDAVAVAPSRPRVPSRHSVVAGAAVVFMVWCVWGKEG